MLCPLLRRVERRLRQGGRGPPPRRPARASRAKGWRAEPRRARSSRRRDPQLQELDLPPPRRAERQGSPAGAAPELVVLYGDLALACATLPAEWPKPPHLASPTSSRRTCAASSAGSTRDACRRPRTRTSRIPATTSGGSCTRPASPRALLDPSEQFELLELGYGATNAAYRTTPGSGDLRRGDFDPERLSRLARALRPRALAFVGKEAYRGSFGERPELGPQLRTLGSTALFVLPSTSPANAAVPYPERLRWFAALLRVARADPAGGRARTGRRRAGAGAPAPLREPRHPGGVVGDSRRRPRGRRERRRGAAPRAARRVRARLRGSGTGRRGSASTSTRGRASFTASGSASI